MHREKIAEDAHPRGETCARAAIVRVCRPFLQSPRTDPRRPSEGFPGGVVSQHAIDKWSGEIASSRRSFMPMIPDDTARMGFLVAARDRAPSMLYGQWKPHGWACRLARLRKPDPRCAPRQPRRSAAVSPRAGSCPLGGRDAPSRSATPPEISGIAWEVTFVLRAERGRPASRRRGTSKPGASLASVH